MYQGPLRKVSRKFFFNALHWRQYLLGAKHRVEVWTDHLNLTYFRQAQKLN